MKRSYARKIGAVMFCLFWMGVSAMLFIGHAEAAIYDNFNNGTVIDTSKWTIVTGEGYRTDLFSQGEGLLNFYSNIGNSKEVLRSNPLAGDFETSVEFHNFFSNSAYSPGYTGPLSGATFGLGPLENRVMVSRNSAGDFNSFRLNASGQVLEYGMIVHGAPTEGMLGLSYIDGLVTAVYNTGFNVNTGWVFLGQFHPGWDPSYQPQIILAGTNFGISGYITFDFDNVGYAPVPLPASVLLFAPGLLGLFAVRRRVRK